MKQGLKLLHTQFFFYLSIVEVIQNERKANFVTLYDRNLSRKRARYVYNVGSINDSRINVKKCASRNGLKLRSANTARSMRCNTAVQDRGRRLNQSHFRSMAEVSFLPLANTRKRASASRENHNQFLLSIVSYSFYLFVEFAEVLILNGKSDAYKLLICIVERVHFHVRHVRVGVINLTKYFFAIFCAEMLQQLSPTL